MEAAETKLKLFGIGEIFGKSKDTSVQRKAIIDWIHKHLKESVNEFGSLGITPIVPRTGPGFVILDFLNAGDAKHFEGTVVRKRNNKDIPGTIHTQRWFICSSQLTGDNESIFYIQNTIVNNYNHHMDVVGLEYRLQELHIRMIRIGSSQKFLKGKAYIVFDFLDPCDNITSLLWYQGTDSFRDHDVKLVIPNPKTRAKIASNDEYAKFTLKDKGLWTTKARARY